MSIKTADLCDQYEAELQVLAPILTSYGGVSSFWGPIATVRVFEDNVKVREALSAEGTGRVLVVDGGGSLRCALVGDQLATKAQHNGWAGLVVYGCIRDAAEIAGIAIGVYALNTHPRRSAKHGFGESGVALRFADAAFRPGSYLYADRDGIVMAERKLVSG